jgi:hypothetical protein
MGEAELVGESPYTKREVIAEEGNCVRILWLGFWVCISSSVWALTSTEIDSGAFFFAGAAPRFN